MTQYGVSRLLAFAPDAALLEALSLVNIHLSGFSRPTSRPCGIYKHCLASVTSGTLGTRNGDVRPTSPLPGPRAALVGCVPTQQLALFSNVPLSFLSVFPAQSSHRPRLSLLISHFSGRCPVGPQTTRSFYLPAGLPSVRCPGCIGPWPVFGSLGAKNCFYIGEGLLVRKKIKGGVTPN